MGHLRRLQSSRAFTLIELLIVILVIGILIAVAAPSFLGQTQKANDSAAKQQLSVAYRAAKAYSVDGNGAPGHVQGTFNGFDVSALTASEPGLTGTSGDCPDDAFGHEHNYIVIDTALNGDLTICNDPDGRVWTITVTANGPPVFSGPATESESPSPPVPVNLTQFVDFDTLWDAYNPTWSDDGSKIYFDAAGGSGRSIYSVPVATPGATPTLVIGGAANSTYPMQHEGRFVFRSDRSGTSELWTFQLGEDPLVDAVQLTPDSVSLDWQALSWDGNTLAYDDASSIYVKALPSGSPLAVTSIGSLLIGETLSPNGDSVAYIRGGALKKVDTTGSGTPVTLVPDGSFGIPTGRTVTPAYSPDGSKIAYGARDASNETYIVIVNATDGSLIKKVDTGPHDSGVAVESLAWSPDGTKIAFDTNEPPDSIENIYFIDVS